ncbi:hypothetical protein GCM10023189_06910 [Nibrella saemangeumensis]|uniref:AAA+ ATPase domain-containing protein n=1 Tax=Nibrella saemangeumensis TaxID=1084526 RepID=A0ABP8MEL3_9BACT
MPIADYHRQIFDFLEKYRQAHPDENITYALREKEHRERPRTEFLFTGDSDRYIFVGMYAPHNGRKKTRSIGIQFEYNKQQDQIKRVCLSIAFDDPDLTACWPVYEEIIQQLGSRLFTESRPKRFKYYYDLPDWRESLLHFLSNEKPVIDEIIRRHGEEYTFFISENSLERNLAYITENGTGKIQGRSTLEIPYKSRYYWKYDSELLNEFLPKSGTKTIIGFPISHTYPGSLKPFNSLKELELHLGDSKNKFANLRNSLYFRDALNGDVVFASRGRNEITAIGVFTDNYQFRSNEPIPHIRPVEWLADQAWTYTSNLFPDQPTLFAPDKFAYTNVGPQILQQYVEKYPQYLPLFKQRGLVEEGVIDELQTAPMTPAPIYPKNIILYGPPGTGKTYSTVDLAVQIVDGVRGKSHQDSKTRFDVLLGDQIEFITFHQNYTYEDFVVGIKPDLDDTGSGLRFSRHEGIFYRIAKRAGQNFQASGSNSSMLNLRPFEEVLEELIQPLVDHNQPVPIPMPSGISYTLIRIEGQRIRIKKSGGDEGHMLTIPTLRDLYEGTVEMQSGGMRTYYGPIITLLQERGKLDGSRSTVLPKNYVLVIDEVNRANMSRVFGELITLLEEDKRLGAENEIRLTLPSGEQFAVPPNLYIIGTMNTADKSLALLDIALRRRFEFIGKYPQYDIPGMDQAVAILLQKLNEAIHKHKQSADFLIGHAYFIGKQNGQLKSVFQNRVIPLLMEYFSGRTDLVASLLAESGIPTRKNEYTFQLEVTHDEL